MIIKNSFSFIILLFFINYSFAATTFVKYKELSSYEQYGMYSSSGCQIQNFAVVLDDQYEITTFGSNINTPWGDGVKKSYYQGTQKLYSLTVLNIPIGTTDEIIFDVTNSNKVTTKIFVPLTQPFQCKKFLLNEYNITQISDIYLYQGTYYGFNIGLNISNDLTAAYSLTCKLSFTQYCSIFKNVNSYFVYGVNLLLNQLNQETFSFVISDYFGNSKTLSIENNIFSYSKLPSVITSMDITPKNNSVFDSHLESFLKVSLQVTYSELNAYPTVKDEKTGQIIPTLGSLILGTPEEQTYLFSALVYGNILSPLQSFTLVEVASPIKNVASFNYSIIDSNSYVPVTSPSFSIVLNNKTGNLLFKTYLNCSKLEFEVLDLYHPSNFSSQLRPTYPYGISKSNNNSNYDINFEGILPNSIYGAVYSIKIGFNTIYGNIGSNSQTPSNLVPIPTNIPGIITSDNEGPVLHEISYELIENGKILITMNITDVGSGVYLIFCIQPYFSLLAKQALISGDINNGIYQFLVNVYEVQTIGIQLYAYDYMGNYGLRNNYFDFYDINFSSVDPVLPYNILPSDITFFEFDRLEVDTSFDDLQVTLRINFKGENGENGSIPLLIPIYGDSRSGILSYFGVFNETTQMFDVKFNVKERERGYFQYLLIIPPLNILETDIEALFPGQRIKLTTNYVDHFAPIITNFRSLTNVNLTINQGDEIEIGWDVEIYDYPTGLRNAYFEVISDKDFEPYTFNFTPNAVVGDDILSTYTIKFSVKPVVNQTYYISKVQLYDKNGYFSQYPKDESSEEAVLKGFASFYNNTFTLERNIQVGLSSSLVSDNTAPTLLSLSFPTSFDSFGINLTAVIEFTVQDDISGISTRHNPYVYIQFNFQGFLSAKSQLIFSNNSTLTNTYSASFEFGYGDLAYGAIVSIHGITDNSMNVLSYSSSQLASKGFPSTIVNPIQIRPPVILDYTNINENGGKLFIYGKEFTNSPVVYMDKGNGFEIISPSFTSNAALTLIIPSVKGIQSLKFKVVSKQTDSNIITIIPIVNPVLVISNCTSLNDCNGKGECINSKCVCNTGSSGPDCSSTTNEINVAPTPATPSFSSFGSMIELNQLNEMDFNGKIVKSYPLTSWESTTIQSQYQSAPTYQYVSELDSTGTTVTVVVDIFNSPANINFAANKLSMDKGTVKYTISFNSYPFASRLNTLQLVVNASIIEPVSNSTCKLNSYSFIENTNSLEWIKLRSNDKSIYGKFIQSGLIDYRSIGIQNKLLVAPTIENQQAIIGVSIPYFFKTAVLDPDFSVLLDTDNLGKNTKSSCYKDENGDGVDSGSTVDDYGVNSSGLSKSNVIIVSVICSVAGVAITIASVLLVSMKSISFRIFIFKFKKLMAPKNSNMGLKNRNYN